MFAVLCETLCNLILIYRLLGALKATGNRGLQPAMDHILEHEGQPVPDPNSADHQPSSSEPMDVDDEDEDTEALKSLGVVAGNAVEAKVREGSSISPHAVLISFLDLTQEHQML